MSAVPRLFYFRLLSLGGLLLLPACSYDPSIDMSGSRPWEEAVLQSTSEENDESWIRERMQERHEFRRQSNG